MQSNTLLPRRFRSSACLRTPAVRVGLPTSHVGTKAMHAARGAGQAFGQFQYLTSPERVEDKRRRAAVDKVTTRSFDRHGNRIWRDTQALLDSERARYTVGEIAVPYGRCTEPSNVHAGGGACPVRFRCAGCEDFRIRSPCCSRCCCGVRGVRGGGVAVVLGPCRAGRWVG